MPARSPRGQPVTEVVATLKARIAQLEAELANEQQRSAGHRADYELERERAERADQVVTTQDRIIAELKNLRSLFQLAHQATRPVPDVARRGVGLAAHGQLMNFLSRNDCALKLINPSPGRVGTGARFRHKV